MPPQRANRFTNPGVGSDGLLAWVERAGCHPVAGVCRGGLRFAFYGRVSTEDYQDPVTSRARQRDLADALIAGHGRIVAGFFDVGQSRVLPWARRPQAAALVAAMADPDRAFDAIVVGEYERAFYGSGGMLHHGMPRAGLMNVCLAVLGAFGLFMACLTLSRQARTEASIVRGGPPSGWRARHRPPCSLRFAGLPVLRI